MILAFSLLITGAILVVWAWSHLIHYPPVAINLTKSTEQLMPNHWHLLLVFILAGIFIWQGWRLLEQLI
jgi:hypothetical protein